MIYSYYVSVQLKQGDQKVSCRQLRKPTTHRIL